MRPACARGRHPPLTDPVTLAARSGAARAATAQRQPPSLLAGLVRCAGVRHEHERDRTRRHATEDASPVRLRAPLQRHLALRRPASRHAAGALRRGHRLRAAAKPRRPPAAKVNKAERKVAAAAGAHRLPRQRAPAGGPRRGHLRRRPHGPLAPRRTRAARPGRRPSPTTPISFRPPTNWSGAGRRWTCRHATTSSSRSSTALSSPAANGHVPDRVTVFPVGCGPTDLRAAWRQARAAAQPRSPARRPAAVAKRTQPRPWSNARPHGSSAPSWEPAPSGRRSRPSWTRDGFRLHQQVMLQGGESGGPTSSTCGCASPTRRAGAGTTTASGARCAPT